MRKRNREVKIRLTEQEFQEIDAAAKELGLSKQAYVLGAISGAVIIPAEELQQIILKFAECNRQLRGMATNINQMAHIANLYNADKEKKLPEEYILLDIYEQVQEMRKECEDAWQSTRCQIMYQKTTAD